MSNKAQMKNTIKQITGFNCGIRDNGSFWTISNKDSDKGSFGKFEQEIKSLFNVTRFDGGSFNIQK